MNNLKDILSNSNKDIDNQQLMDYLSGKLNAAEQQAFEEQMAENDLFNDALEGLQQVENKQQLDLIQYELNRKLRQQLQDRGHKKERRKIQGFQLTIITIIIILILCVLAFVVIYMNNKK
jgi:ferric-dicitrate binding protein FerR (iron transport regulator)